MIPQTIIPLPLLVVTTVIAQQVRLWSHSAFILATSGLDSGVLTLFMIVLAGAIFLWGMERYRTNFSRMEFFVVLLLSGGIFLIGVFPDAFKILGGGLNIDRRPLVITLITNSVFVVLVLYLFTRTRTTQLSIAELTQNLTADQAVVSDDSGPTIYIVIPVYNESTNIRHVVDALPPMLRGYALRPLVVSDGSTDAIVEQIDQIEVTAIGYPTEQGGALKTGFEIAQLNDADIVVTMDADGHYPVEQIDDIIAPIIADRADYVVGSRYAGMTNSDNSVPRWTGNQVMTTLINSLIKEELTDCMSEFRAIRGSKIDDLTLTEERFNAPELLIEARKNRFRIGEVPVVIASSKTDEMKQSTLGYALGLTHTVFHTWLRCLTRIQR